MLGKFSLIFQIFLKDLAQPLAAYPLDVSGQINIAPANASGTQPGIRLFDSGAGSNEGLMIQWNSGERSDCARILGVGDTQGGNLVFFTNASATGNAQQRMIINRSGYV